MSVADIRERLEPAQQAGRDGGEIGASSAHDQASPTYLGGARPPRPDTVCRRVACRLKRRTKIAPSIEDVPLRQCPTMSGAAAGEFGGRRSATIDLTGLRAHAYSAAGARDRLIHG